MRLLSEVVHWRVDAAATFTAFYAMAEPRLPAVLDRVARTGRFDAVIVHPHLLFEGRLHQAIVAQIEDVSRNHPSLEIVCAPYLGPHRLVVDAIADRIRVEDQRLLGV